MSSSVCGVGAGGAASGMALPRRSVDVAGKMACRSWRWSIDLLDLGAGCRVGDGRIF